MNKLYQPHLLTPRDVSDILVTSILSYDKLMEIYEEEDIDENGRGKSADYLGDIEDFRQMIITDEDDTQEENESDAREVLARDIVDAMVEQKQLCVSDKLKEEMIGLLKLNWVIISNNEDDEVTELGDLYNKFPELIHYVTELFNDSGALIAMTDIELNIQNHPNADFLLSLILPRWKRGMNLMTTIIPEDSYSSDVTSSIEFIQKNLETNVNKSASINTNTIEYLFEDTLYAPFLYTISVGMLNSLAKTVSVSSHLLTILSSVTSSIEGTQKIIEETFSLEASKKTALFAMTQKKLREFSDSPFEPIISLVEDRVIFNENSLNSLIFAIGVHDTEHIKTIHEYTNNFIKLIKMGLVEEVNNLIDLFIWSIFDIIITRTDIPLKVSIEESMKEIRDLNKNLLEDIENKKERKHSGVNIDVPISSLIEILAYKTLVNYTSLFRYGEIMGDLVGYELDEELLKSLHDEMLDMIRKVYRVDISPFELIEYIHNMVKYQKEYINKYNK